MRVKWAEPPEPKVRTSNFAPLYELLKRRPGKWAILKKKFRGSAYIYNKNHPDFEFVTRGDRDGSRTCFVRYVGGTRGKRGKKAKK